MTGIDDLTGEPLMKRKDDNATTLKTRLGAFHEQVQTLPQMCRIERVYFATALARIFANPLAADQTCGGLLREAGAVLANRCQP